MLGMTRSAYTGTKRYPNFLAVRKVPAIARGINRPVFKNQKDKKSAGVRSHDDFPNIQKECQSEPSRSGSCQIRTGSPRDKLGNRKKNQNLLLLITAHEKPIRRTAPNAKTWKTGRSPAKTPAKKYVFGSCRSLFNQKRRTIIRVEEKPMSVGRWGYKNPVTGLSTQFLSNPSKA